MSKHEMLKIVCDFQSLTSKDRIQVLDKLLDVCEAQELWHLEQKLPVIFYRDFVKWLPPEVAYRVLRFLDCQSLLQASQVSRIWNKRISNFTNLWRVKATALGVSLHEKEPVSAKDWKYATIFVLQFRQGLLSGKVFKHQTCTMQNFNYGAMSYHQGHLLCSVSKDPPHMLENQAHTAGIHRLVLCCPQTRSELGTFPTTTRPSVLKLWKGEAVVCGHFDGMASSFDLRQPPSNLKYFRAHAASILSIDLNTRLGIFATGSADSSVKIWNLFSDQLLKTLSNFTHWVVSIILKDSTQHCLPRFQGKNILLTMTRDEIALFSWQDNQFSFDELRTLTAPNFSIPLKGNEGWSLKDVFFTPGLILSGQRIAFVKQLPMFDTLTIGDAEILVANGNTGQIENVYHVNHKIRKLLSIGRRFCLILLPYVEPTFKNVVVLDLKDSKIIGGCTIPHSRATTPDFSQVAVCDTDWLDGIDHDTCHDKTVLALASSPDFNLHLVKWSF